MGAKAIELTVFAGQEKGFVALKYLCTRHDVRINRVVVSVDRNVRSDFSAEIVDFCKSLGIPTMRRLDLHDTHFAIAVGFRELIDWPIGRLVVLHDSLLPKYRGFAPVPSMLENGEKKLGVTAFVAGPGYDAGEILAYRSAKIRYPMKIKEALLLNHSNYIYCLGKVLGKLHTQKDKLSGRRQSSRRATYSLWRDLRDYQVNWARDAERIVRFIHAVGDPYDGAQTYLGSRPVRITDARSVGAVRVENPDPGKVIWRSHAKDNIEPRATVVCGTGLVEILEANFIDTGESIFPLKSARVRFEGRQSNFDS